MQFRTYKTLGVVIKRINFGEADKLLTVFTREHGKIHCLAKGIRKPTSRKAASLELFNQVAIFLAKGKNLDLITETQVIDSFPSWRKKLEKVALAYQGCELIDRLMAEGQENKAAFDLLLQFLGELNQEDFTHEGLILDFKKKLLQLTGFGLPEKLDPKSLDDYLEKITEKRMTANFFLKKLRDCR